jgi:hypothetical protein
MPSTDDIRAHIERHLGPIQQVFNQWADESLPISVQHVAPVETRPVHTLVTLGMSARAMDVPAQEESPAFLELMMTLPEHWKLDAESSQEEEWSWPIRLLQSLASRPHKSAGWLGWGHIVPNGEPPRAYAQTTKQCAALIVPSLLVPTSFYELATAEKTITFYAVVPIYEEEWALSRASGTQVLLERIVDQDMNDVLDPKRKNVARKRFWPF